MGQKNKIKYMRKLINSQMIGKTIKTLRESKHMTQSEVARKLNMTQVMVSRYEKKSLDKMRMYMTV